MAANFNLQAHLEAMEGRIREDIKECRSDIQVVQIGQAAHDGRIKNLEEKAGWIGAGLATGVISLCTAAWAIVTGR